MSFEDKQHVCADCYVIATRQERERIIKLLQDLGAIRRDALGHLCAFNTEGTEVIYLPGLEEKE